MNTSRNFLFCFLLYFFEWTKIKQIKFALKQINITYHSHTLYAYEYTIYKFFIYTCNYFVIVQLIAQWNEFKARICIVSSICTSVNMYLKIHMYLCMYENTYVRIPKNIHTKLTGILYFCRTTILAARTLIKHLSALQQNGKQLDYCLCIVMLKATNIYTNNPHLRRPPDCHPLTQLFNHYYHHHQHQHQS